MITITSVARLELTIGPFDWPFQARNRDRIAQHFAGIQAAKPEVWNGPCLQCRNPRIDDDVFRTDYFRTDYATFLAWRDWNEFDGDVHHCFSAGALRSADGAFILGRMAQSTANAGRVYFPSGTPDPSDIIGDRVDLGASVTREMAEETGLTERDYAIQPSWSVVDAGRVIACIRPLRAHAAADDLVTAIRQNLSRQQNPELDDMVVVRGPADFTDAMPDFVKAYIADVMARGH